MKKLFSLLLSLFTLAAVAQTRTQPVFNMPGPGFDKFMARHFRVVPLLPDTLATNAGPEKVLFSFIITPEGRPDSLIFHECRYTGIENDVRRVMALPENRWRPAMRNKRPVTSAPVYYGIVIYSSSRDGELTDTLRPALTYFRLYPYQKLSNWQPGSTVFKPMQVVVFATIKCGLSPRLAIALPPSPSRLQGPMPLIPYRGQPKQQQ